MKKGARKISIGKKSDITIRINRASGQVSALSKMIDEERGCAEVVVQFQAAKRALERAYGQFLHENLEICIKNKDTKAMKVVINSITSQ